MLISPKSCTALTKDALDSSTYLQAGIYAKLFNVVVKNYLNKLMFTKLSEKITTKAQLIEMVFLADTIHQHSLFC
ncbi:hypothetical protein EGR_06558 [Echinococcus granulosus]|uniref:Uncharacterized protein n=1 Tax=Echinococcus granulosus TaxID=6210 RepID=W6UCU0_ECHGR|nr:hypothetical protein EGR_06558 [Echinococcus granulosus]EUB58571.1 hypothetical protein EGR_06558 [Echinococcus granulosus]